MICPWVNIKRHWTQNPDFMAAVTFFFSQSAFENVLVVIVQPDLKSLYIYQIILAVLFMICIQRESLFLHCLYVCA